ALRNVHNGPVRDRRSAVDDMGYEWRDILEDDGPEYEWVDIRQWQGTRAFNMGDDQNSGAVQLGWEFPFWDRIYRQVFLDTDGWMSFSYGGNNIGVEPNTYPVAVAAGAYRDATIAMANLDNLAGTDVYFWTNNNDLAIMQWLANHVNQYELILNDKGLAKIQYGPNAGGRSGAVGVNLGDGRHGWYISPADNNRFVEGYVWAFGGRDAWLTWMTWDPREGVLRQGADIDMTVTLNATGLVEGRYEAELYIFSNDPVAPEDEADVVIAITVDVTGAAVQVITWTPGFPNVIDFNAAYRDLFSGGPYPVEVTIENAGTAALVVEDITSDDDNFYADPANFEVPVGESRVFNAIIDAAEDGEHSGTLTIVSNAAEDEEHPIRVQGTTSAPPEIIVDPLEIEVDMVTGEVIERTVNIANAGAATLFWNTELEIIGEPGDDANARALRSVNDHRQVWNALPGLQLPNSADQVWNAGWAAVPERAVRVIHNQGPQRDQPESNFLLIQETNPWGFNLETIFSGFQGLSYRRIQTPSQLDNLDLRDYDCMWVGNYESDAWNTQYNQRRAVVDEWVDRGGAYYMCTGTNNWGVAPTHPGNLTRIVYYAMQGVTQLTREENFLFNLMNWDRGTVMSGNWFSHAGYTEDALNRIENTDGYEVMIRGAGEQDGGNNLPVVVIYSYGQGWCVVSGSTDGFLHADPGTYIWGQTGQALLWYLDFLANYHRWISWDPTEGEVGRGGDIDMVVTLNADGLIEGDYEADLHILNNDPANRDVVVHIFVHVTGAPAILTTPLAHPLPNAPEAIAFPNTYVGVQARLPVIIENVGTRDLHINEVAVENDDVFGTTIEADVALGPGEELEAALIFRPNDLGRFDGVVTLNTDAENVDEGIVWFNLTGLGWNPPEIFTDPDRVSVVIPVGEEAHRTLVVGNEAGAPREDLAFRIYSEEPEGAFDANRRGLRSVNNGPVRDRRSQPDDMSYEWRDLLEDDGPEYEWVDIRQWQGTRAFNMGDDQNSGAVQLGWEFPFWNRVYRQVFMDTDGWMSFSYGGNNIGVEPNTYPVAVAAGAYRD
ncbi:MAG: choice-of-anchor D domain-containing protein, partial [Calditrichaeota bacterium]|nr:choice-of-anchor D domain-containing protein [Calditrichota bacterium]